MDRVLHGMTWKQVLVYLDDILLFSKNWPDHLEGLKELFIRLRDAKLKLKPIKCTFGTSEVNYLGFKISDKGIQPSHSKIMALTKTERPITNKVLLSFLCAINYYRSEIPNFAELTADLYDLASQKHKNVNWTPETIKNYNILKKALTLAPILAFPDFAKEFFFQTDASIKSIGGVCLQMYHIWRPVMFFGRKLYIQQQSGSY